MCYSSVVFLAILASAQNQPLPPLNNTNTVQQNTSLAQTMMTRTLQVLVIIVGVSLARSLTQNKCRFYKRVYKHAD